ncbi:hypothetical protein [Halolamina salifodinae]|uniref:Uncharacterized protein n=1 Tax=Halolamina salifodinae TaxID=1202767 RepID=A0A8T4GYP1_9EURY|nr:hypothetical protein [Halolamina salifodinae]MBP1988116.1 hypothetical protein [Halolamina salifodinae]
MLRFLAVQNGAVAADETLVEPTPSVPISTSLRTATTEIEPSARPR